MAVLAAIWPGIGRFQVEKVMNDSFQNQIQLFKSVFKGRDDVFAIRWEKGDKSGYMPAYYFDPYRYRAHKMKGGGFQNYTDKTYLKLTDDEIAKHIKGEQLIGIYPLLPDNTSWFLASNFASAIVIEAGLSFLGVGVQPPQPSWGLMIKENYNFIITQNPMLALAPGFAIMLLVLAFNLLGNGLRDALNVRGRV